MSAWKPIQLLPHSLLVIRGSIPLLPQVVEPPGPLPSDFGFASGAELAAFKLRLQAPTLLSRLPTSAASATFKIIFDDLVEDRVDRNNVHDLSDVLGLNVLPVNL